MDKREIIIMKKIFKNIEVLNIVSYVNQMSKEKLDELPLKFRWNLKKNIDKLRPIAESYENFRNDQVKQLQSEWFNEEKSEEFMQVKTDENGEPMKDGEGNEITEPMRKIKDEYMVEYQKVVSELNTKLNEIAYEDNEIEIVTVDFDIFIDSLPDDSSIDFDDITMLSFMDTTTNIKEAE